jgi:hypothetical protein
MSPDNNGSGTTGPSTTESSGTTTNERTETQSTAGFIDGDDVLAEPLPPALRSALGDFVGTDPVDTLGEWVAEVRRHTGGGSIAVEDLCHTDDDTPHWGELDGERYHFVCFYDAVILAAAVDATVAIHTESPDGAVVEAEATGDDALDVTPETAVFSFGIGVDAAANSDGDPSLEDFYTSGCPYVKAFPSREAYAEWSADAPAYTVALPLDGATDIAAALAE